MIKGIDLSSYQGGGVDFHSIKKAGYDFVFIKASEGSHHVDSYFKRNWEESKSAGLLRTGYHYYHPSEGAIIQAKHLAATVALTAGDLPLVIDVEKQGLDPAAYEISLRTCLHTVEKISGVKPIIYTSPSWWDSHLQGDFSDFHLWVAHYTTRPQPNLPRGWKSWSFWQWSSSGQAPGIQGHVDLDRYAGTMEELKALVKT